MWHRSQRYKHVHENIPKIPFCSQLQSGLKLTIRILKLFLLFWVENVETGHHLLICLIMFNILQYYPINHINISKYWYPRQNTNFEMLPQVVIFQYEWRADNSIIRVKSVYYSVFCWWLNNPPVQILFQVSKNLQSG